MSLPSPTTSSIMNDPASQQPQEQLVLDAPLIALTQKCNGDLRLVLHSFFSFLHRRTDFYCVHNPQDVQEGNRVSMGFREGDAEKLLLAAFRQFPLRRMPPMSQLVSNHKDATTSSSTSSGTSSEKKNSGSGSDSYKEQPPSTEKTDNDDDDHQNHVNVRDKDDTKKKKHNDEDEFKIRYTADGYQVPIGNGGSTKQYKWTQTLQEVTIAIPLPSTPPDIPTTTTATTITGAKDLIVEMKPLHICIGKKSETDEKVVSLLLLKGELVEKIRPDECTWSIESNVMLITLEKMEKKWWDRIFKEDEERIDLALVDKTHLISDYDEATQGMIRRILFDQRQERLGLAKSDKILVKQQQQQEKGKGDLEKNVREDTGLGALKDCHGNSVEADNLPAGVEFIDKYSFPAGS